jgi:translation initiation factor IF-3
MDYGKWLYRQKRKLREAHKKHHLHAGTLKEIRLRPETEQHDLEIKVNHAREFLEKGHKVQFTLFFRGRQMLHTDQGYAVLDRITQSLADLSKVRKQPPAGKSYSLCSGLSENDASCCCAVTLPFGPVFSVL